MGCQTVSGNSLLLDASALSTKDISLALFQSWPTDMLRGFKCLDLYLIFHTAARVAFLKYSWIPSTE